MEPTILQLRKQLDTITAYLSPLLPLANCHMVEFLTLSHWERLIPASLRSLLDRLQLADAVEMFWDIAANDKCDDASELGKWITAARAHCLSVNDVYCMSSDQLQDRIKAWGGRVKPQIRVKEYMSSKKSYEVERMSCLVSSLSSVRDTCCCVEAGGGRGHLPLALGLAYGLRTLTVDCDERVLASARHRLALIQKQWHAIAKRVSNGTEEQLSGTTNTDLHRYARSYITKDTDLCAIVKESFPDLTGEVKLLLTGLHTCGNLGPNSLRIFVSQPSTAAVFNVPCCYHLLTETVDVSLFDIFQRDFGSSHNTDHGFPMSQYLAGYNLGRNARMLAAQSIDRVISLRQLPPRSLLYRALFQVIIKKHKPSLVLAEGKLKRISSKCQDFEHYFKMADAILKLNLVRSLPDGFLSDICKDIECQWKHMVLFYLLRLCLAQVIESVILLDRLLFLMENNFEKVYLVKLFDPVMSPRCHSIVAVR